MTGLAGSAAWGFTDGRKTGALATMESISSDVADGARRLINGQ
jgi:hypothetical protein